MTRPEDPARQEDPTLTYLTHSAAYGRPGQGDGVLLGLFRLLSGLPEVLHVTLG